MSWENDANGRPCKWQRHITVTLDDYASLGGSRMMSAEKSKEIDDAIEACREALKALEASEECYVIVVEPELTWRRDMECDYEIHTVRARVKWMPNKEAAEQYHQRKADILAAVDDEWSKGLSPTDPLPELVPKVQE